MTNKTVILLLIFLFFNTLSFCQNKYEVGIVGGLLDDKNYIHDKDKNLLIIPSYGGLVEISFRINKNNRLFYEFATQNCLVV